MDLSRRLRISTLVALIVFIICVQTAQSRFVIRPKRQYGANMYLPASSITPGGDGDPSEWTEWSSPSQCSRSCGGGVSYQERECRRIGSNGEPICSGGNRRYFSCNTQDCPEDEPDFRTQQCRRFNSVPFDGIQYDWVPYMNAPNPCELNCMPVGERFYYRHKAQVIDGTRCNDKELDVCVNGQCQPVGCDMMLGSNAKEDKCRKCDGDGSTCKTIADKFNSNNLAAGYNDIFLIPSGATNIRIQEVAPSNNYLACRNLTGHYYLNGNWRIDFPRPMFYAGTWWNYQRKPTGFAAPDQLTASGPTTESLFIVVLMQDKLVNIDYEYSIPESVSQNSPDVYSWTHMEFEPCSVPCGGGTQTRRVTCNNRITLEEVDPSLCDANSKPEESQECNKDPCAPHWIEGEWGKCSKGCGEDGMQNRTVTCERISPNGEHTKEDDAVCLKSVGNKPATTQECNREVKNCPKYHLGPWTPCDKLCGDGKQKRKVTCYIEENGHKKVLPDEECIEEKPETEKSCLLTPCEGVDWITSPWSGCEACGQKTETRTVICASKAGKIYSNEFCGEEVPELSKPCESKSCATLWFTSEWGKCSSACGKGVQSRVVICGEFDGKNLTPTDESKCDASKKPESEQDCEGEEKECPGEWFTGPWSPCSKPCGGGERTREILCLSNGTKSSNCDESKLEPLSEKCNTQACTEDEVIPVDSTAQPITADSGEDYDEDCSEEEDEDMEVVTDKMGDDLKISDGIDLDEESTTLSSLMTDELMLSDAPGSGDTTLDEYSSGSSLTTVEGSGEDTESTDSSSLVSEGSGDETDATTESGISTEQSGSTELPESTVTSSDLTTSSEDTSQDTSVGSSEATTESSDGSTVSEGSTVSDGSTVSEGSTASEGSTISEGSTVSEASTDSEGSTESSAAPLSTESSATELTESTESSQSTEYLSTIEVSTDSSVSTESAASSESSDSPKSSDVTEASNATDDSTDVSETTESVGSTESPASTESSGTTESSGSTEASDSTPTPDSSVSTDSTDSTVSESTESSVSTESTESTSESSTDSSISTDSTTDSSTESTVTSSDISTDGSSASTVDSSETTESATTDSTVEGSTDGNTDLTTEGVSGDTTEGVSGETTEDVTGVTSDGTTDAETGSTSESGTDGTDDTTITSETSATSDGVTDESTIEESSVSSITDTTDLSESTVSGSTETEDTTATGLSDDTTESSGETDLTDTTDSTESSISTTTVSEITSSTDETTEITGSTETSVSTETPESTETPQSTETSETPESTETSETSEFTTSSDITESTESTESGATEESTIEISTESSLSTEEETTIDIWTSTKVSDEDEDEDKSTPNTLEAIVTKESKQRKCKPKQKKDCKNTEYGCCPDNKTAAKGPFDEGCPIPKTCAETDFGCCLDGVSPAQGKNNKGCPKSQCAETLFGCCPDKFTPAEGENEEGCPELTTLPPTTTTEAPEETEKTETPGTEDTDATEAPAAPEGDRRPDLPECVQSPNGCCDDGRTAATGPNKEGCASCTSEPFGCCPDKQTPAHGPLGEGCCLNSPYGCCPDNINYARGPNFEDCDCRYTPYGCCPDSKTAARGPSNEGCGCEISSYGCCPDKLTSARGPKFEGCACHTMQFGCCPDGITIAQGPHHYGCDCSQTEFKCCPDKKTAAKGPNEEGCTCVESEHGCCPDGVSAAQGAKFEGCDNVREPPQKACNLPKDTGPGRSFSIKYFFDTSYGACAPFWYGGSDGNENRFETEAECKAVCQEFEGKESCLLPKSSGPCTGYNKKWYFDSDRGRCEEFNYGGCYGTTNRFDSLEQCQLQCSIPESIPPCEQPMERGPCEGNFERWFYDNNTDVCRPFVYGGCKGNKNNYPTEHACNYNCRQPGVHKDYCSLPKQTGDCSEQHARWYFSDSDKKCMPFYYTGCGGNKNNFPTQESCEDHCPKEVAKDVCEIPAQVGECTNWVSMWYYDTKDERCRQFYYGGCGGNENKFQTEEACLERCEKKPEPEPEPEPEPAPEPEPRPVPEGNVCELTAEPGDCSNYVIQWYFDTTDGSCRQFYYGGCGGNGNRFNTREECDQQCLRQPAPVPESPPAPPTGDICQMPSSVGDCSDYVLKWFFNVTEGRCAQFYYGGCGGNNNRFETQQDCESRCAFNVDSRFGEPEPEPEPEPEIVPEPAPEPDNAVVPPVSDSQKCFYPAESGNCYENVTRWYYDSEAGLCDEFIYTGCGGNANNFATEEECQDQCDDVQTTCELKPYGGRCQENLVRWYFDDRSQRCHQFTFTGCRGNRNNFVTEAECLTYCGREPEPHAPVEPGYSVCDLTVDPGNCDNYTAAWYYDVESMSCTAFSYSGCGGNGNKFATKEQCDRQCGEFKGIDVCNEPVRTGPCRQWLTRFYYNKETRTCEPFTYGGCDGTGNRFTDQAECESVCIAGQEVPAGESRDICKLPVNIGQCNGPSLNERRYYYDDERGNCVSFIYAGCSGNQNNFRTYESCIDYCAKPVDTNEIPNEVAPNRCEAYEDECRQLRCPFGIHRVPVDEECTRCECENPCEQHRCPDGQQCAVDISDDINFRQFVPVCREINKPGACPQLPTNSSNCLRECYSDADCRGDNKCCSDGCGYLCVLPIQTAPPTRRPTTAAPPVLYPGDEKAALEPKTPQELGVQAAVGGIAVLRCFATGTPPPNVTWSLQGLVIDTNQGRYVLTSTGDLTIVQVRQTDSGSYVCVASNGLGEPVRREVDLQVTEPEVIPAYVYGSPNVTQIVTLNRPAQVRCPAGGHPEPHVSWWRNRKRLPLVSNKHELLRDYSLMFRSIQLTDLGPYTCEVWNGQGRPASIQVTLKALGPARASNDEESPYLKYILDPTAVGANAPPLPAYRPSRPVAVPSPVIVVEPPRRSVPVQAVMSPDPRNSYTPGSTIVLNCAVDGVPAPEVSWSKDGVPLLPTDHIQITTEPHRLLISNITAADSGRYSCNAKNPVSYSSSEESVNIESNIPLHADCVDNPYFANCKLIVKGKYCHHHYYAKFCCRSCTLAGQLDKDYLNTV